MTTPERPHAVTCPEDQPTGPLAHPRAVTCPEDQPTATGFLAPGSATRSVVRTVALIVWASLAGGACRDDAADPVRTAQLFTAAVQRGDMHSVIPLLEQTAQTRLTAAAEQASDQVGGRRRLEATEMLQIVDLPPTFELAETVLVDNDGATAHVRLVGALQADGQREILTLTLVREDGAWHVRIPTPP